ncbi:hypothetical protein K457DRAFT_26401 [Linnemannia elongata AG-77]|uniref:Uncharacterized protein n=1 Tax=Linnemannia elongata AG-77 TaxID=1314771 RepID=A0A197K545_9FUNG|nr:hypothetical protein K457DRAFT_26401 [Linnemannia elongata AG-77]
MAKVFENSFFKNVPLSTFLIDYAHESPFHNSCITSIEAATLAVDAEKSIENGVTEMERPMQGLWAMVAKAEDKGDDGPAEAAGHQKTIRWPLISHVLAPKAQFQKFQQLLELSHFSLRCLFNTDSGHIQQQRPRQPSKTTRGNNDQGANAI